MRIGSRLPETGFRTNGILNFCWFATGCSNSGLLNTNWFNFGLLKTNCFKVGFGLFASVFSMDFTAAIEVIRDRSTSRFRRSDSRWVIGSTCGSSTTATCGVLHPPTIANMARNSIAMPFPQ